MTKIALVLLIIIFLIITDDNTNLTEINSINNNHNVTLINDYLIVQATSACPVSKFFQSPNIQLVQLGTGYQQRIFVQVPALKLGMKQILLKIVRKINKISTNIII